MDVMPTIAFNAMGELLASDPAFAAKNLESTVVELDSGHLHGFGQMPIHAAFHRLLQVIVESVGRHGHNRYGMTVRPLHATISGRQTGGLSCRGDGRIADREEGKA